jgi:DNA-binding response OmpR family regulator
MGGQELEGASVMVVVPDPQVARSLADELTADGFSVSLAVDADDALRLMARLRPEAAVIEAELPRGDGIALVGRIREGRPDDRFDDRMAIVLLASAGEPHQAVRALERGADDWMERPLHYPELLARLRMALRRARGLTTPSLMRVGPLTVDRRARSATVAGRAVELSAKELGLLTVLAREPRRVVTKHELLRDVWGFTSAGRTRTVDSHASRLRRKLAERGCQGLVCNVWGVGYRLLPDDVA